MRKPKIRLAGTVLALLLLPVAAMARTLIHAGAVVESGWSAAAEGGRRAATVSSAELLEVEDRLGSIEAGKSADLIAVEGDPLADVSLLESVAFVMKDGVVYKSP